VPRPDRLGPTLAVLLLIAGLAAAARLLVGTSLVGWPVGEGGDVLRELRWDRLRLAAVAGTALSVGGVALQALLRNALAEPFILGLSTGAAAGIVGQRLLAATLGFSIGAGYVGAAVGSGLCMAIVYLASRRRGVIDPLGLLLTGVVLSTINGALLMLAVHLRPGLLRVELSQWMMGYLDLDAAESWRWTIAVAVTAASLLWLLKQARAMDVATLSASEAKALGVDLRRLRAELFAIASLLAAAAVVLAGPVAFVGLVCPHVARLLVGPGHRGLLLCSAILGGTLVVLADTTSAALDLAFGIGVVPLGIFTAVVGGVAFLWMLRPHLGRGLE
jgi:iron complex transport system permease protein